MPFNKATDLDLIADLKAGSQEALTEIFRRHWKPLYLSAFYKLRSHELAEEIVQELFTDLWDKRANLLSRSMEVLNLRAYLDRAVKNKVLNQIRKKVYDQKYFEYCKAHLPVFDNSASEMTEYNDLQTSLDVAMEKLSDKTR